MAIRLAVAAAAVLIGCSPYERRADLVVINGTEPESLDPHLVTGQPDLRAVHALFEGLTRFDPQTADPIPGLAESWTVSPDAKTYRFRLRTNARWSTGEPIMADDVVFSWHRALDPVTAADYAGLLFYIRGAEAFNAGKARAEDVGVRALDPTTVQVELNSPTAFFLDLCAMPVMSVVPRSAIEKLGDRWLKARPLPVSGAYQLVSWRVNDRVRVQRNPFYWDAARAQLDLIDLISADQPSTALNLYETGGADIIWDKSLVPAELMDLMRRRPDCHEYDFLGTCFVRFNITRPPFHDVRVRKALSMVIDKQRLVDRITRSGEKPATHMTPPGIGRYEPPAGLPFDPAAARRLLAEAGFPGGKGFPPREYLYNTSRANEQIAVELQAAWQSQLGLDIRPRPIDGKIFFSEQSRTNYDVCRSSWVGDYKDPNTFLDLFMSQNGNNRTGWSHPRYDALVREANSQTNSVRRFELLREAETILVRDDVPVLPLYFYAGVAFYDPNKLAGIGFNLLDEHPLWAIRRLTGAAGKR